jgi:predicted nucleotidyltransferase
MQNDITPIKQELDALTKIIAETVPVEEIYLFGSYAYGTPHKDSDFDIYVVLKDDALISVRRLRRLHRLNNYNLRKSA